MARDGSRWSWLILSWILYATVLVSAEKDEPVLYGSDQSLPGILTVGGRRGWLDPNVRLKFGIVHSIVAYIGDLTDLTVPLAVRFQVWTEDVDRLHRLKWEKRVEVSEGGRLMKIELAASERVNVTEKDSIGFTCEQAEIPIAYQTTPDYDVNFHAILANEPLPSVGDRFNFHPTYPAKFAFGVYVGKVQVGSLQYKGNPLETSEAPENTGQRAWVDRMVTLTSGLVSRIDFQAAQTQGTNVKVIAQVWFPKDVGFTLVWQHEITVDKGPGKYSIAVPPHESVVVNSSCHLGWTFPGKEGPIYYTFDPKSRTQFFRLDEEGNVPKVGETYPFDLKFPHRFSIGVWVDTGMTEVPREGGSTDAASTQTTSISLGTLLMMAVCGHALL